MCQSWPLVKKKKNKKMLGVHCAEGLSHIVVNSSDVGPLLGSRPSLKSLDKSTFTGALLLRRAV